MTKDNQPRSAEYVAALLALQNALVHALLNQPPQKGTD